MTALDRVLECLVTGSEIIRAARPDAVLLHNDVCERWIPDDERSADEVALLNELRFVAFEVALGREPHATATDWLARHGMDDARLAWLVERGSSQGVVIGHDYYPGNEHVVFAPGRSRTREPLAGYASVAAEYHERLGMPFMLAETNRDGDPALDWLADCWNDVLALRDAGLPVRGMCWYSLTDQVDWDTALAESNNRINPRGLVDLDRRMRPVGRVYARLAHAARTGTFTAVRRAERPNEAQ